MTTALLSKDLTFQEALYNPSKTAEVIYALTSPGGLEVGERRTLFRAYPSSFSAAELLAWFEKNAKFTRSEALFFARFLNTSHVIHCAANRAQTFNDDDSFWRFQMHEEGPLNWKQIQLWEVDEFPCALAADLYRKLLRLVKRVVNIKSGTFLLADLAALASTKEFEEFEFSSSALQRVHLAGLTKEQRTAFWINVHNLLALHAVASEARAGRDPYTVTYFSRRAFFTSFKYMVAGLEYTLDDIEFGILRGNVNYFATGDPRCAQQILHVDPRFVWTLNSVNTTSPQPLVVRSEYLPLYLDFACARHIQSTIRIDDSGVLLPRECQEQGNSPEHVVRFVQKYLGVSQRRELVRLVKENKLNLRYVDPEWQPRIHIVDYDLEPDVVDLRL